MKNNRRDFIKKVTLGAAGLGLGTNTLSAKSYANIIGANDRINLAIQGLGRRYPAFIPPIPIKTMMSNCAIYAMSCKARAIKQWLIF